MAKRSRSRGVPTRKTGRPASAEASTRANAPSARRRPEERRLTTSAVPEPAVAPAVGWPAPPPSPPAGPAPEAVAMFQHGMEALQRKEYREAADTFNSLIARFTAERALLDRARVYLDLCERELRRAPAEPRTTEERLTAATAALNNDEDARAEELARRVLADDPQQDLALYLLAAVDARRGAIESSLDLLSRAIELSPEAGQQARYDPDFDSLHDSELFWKLTDKRHASSGSGMRPKVRRRSESKI